MLYTVVPLDQIYKKSKDKGSVDMKKELVSEEYKEFQIDHGHIIAKKQGDEYVVNQIRSTNMKDYLNSEYFPGQNYKK